MCQRLVVGIFVLLAGRPASAQEPAEPSVPDATPSPAPTGRSPVAFLAGAAIGFVAHESGHLTLDFAFGAHPGFRHVHYGPIPFFAVTHDPVSPRREYAISSAGFTVQHATSEWLLTRRPHLREEHAPFAKGLLAFDVLASVAYAGAALTKTGPLERDTRGMAASLRVDEAWIGALLLTPAALDTYRYYHSRARWARWVSRAAKIATVLLVVR